jgi:hypothetical protein
MGQYLGGILNVVVGFYTGNVWEMAGGVMQIVGTKTNNSDLAAAGAVVGTVAGIAGAVSASSAAAQSSSAGTTAANTSSAAGQTATGLEGNAAASTGSALPNSLQLTPSVRATPTVVPGVGDEQQALSTWDKVKSALSTPTGVQVATGVVGGIGNAYGQAYAAQKTAEAQQQLHANDLAFRKWQASIANTSGTGVVNAATPTQYGAGLLGPVSAMPTQLNSLPAATNPLVQPAIPNALNINPAGLSV